MTDADGLAGLRVFIALDSEDGAYVSALTTSSRASDNVVSVVPDENLAATLRAQTPAPDVVFTTLEAADRWLARDSDTGHLPLVVLAHDADPDAYERVLGARRGAAEYLKRANEPNFGWLMTALLRASKRSGSPSLP
jgi:hypothetical protein